MTRGVQLHARRRGEVGAACGAGCWRGKSCQGRTEQLEGRHLLRLHCTRASNITAQYAHTRAVAHYVAK